MLRSKGKKERPQPGPDGRAPLLSPTTLADLTDDLLWPRLLSAVPLAIRPERLFIAFLAVVLMTLALEVANAMTAPQETATDAMPMFTDLAAGHVSSAGEALGEGLRSLDVEKVVRPVVGITLGTPRILFDAYPWTTVLCAVVLVVLWSIGGGTISRMAACDMAKGTAIPWPEALAFSVKRWPSLFGAMLSPLVLVLILGGLISLVGILMTVPGLDLIGGVLYGPMLVLGAMGVFILGAYLLAAPLLIPAVTCEGTDTFDAASRAFSYAIGRPIRLIFYVAILTVLGVVTTTLVMLFATATIGFVSNALSIFTGARVDSITGMTAESGTPAGTMRLVKIWNGIPLLLIGAYAVSYIHAASTVGYLLLRYLYDGQDIHELWMPGQVERAMADALAARKAAQEGE